MKSKAAAKSISLDHRYNNERNRKEFGVALKRFEPTEDELEILARYYLERSYDCALDALVSGQISSDAYWLARLGEIEEVLGQARFEAAIRGTRERFKKEYEELAKSR
jgi:hypothetical protein